MYADSKTKPMDVRQDPNYNQKEGEYAEISCPIQVESQIIGIIGLIAFTPEQQSKMSARSDTYLNFLRRMSELIASKLIESQSNSKLASMPPQDFSGTSTPVALVSMPMAPPSSSLVKSFI